MRLAVSNIAWSAQEDEAAAELLASLGVRNIELAPTRQWPDLSTAPESEVTAYRQWWQDRGFDVVAVQSILFGRPELQIFQDEPGRQTMLEYIRHTIRVAAGLGAGVMVFGSPKNRRRGELSEDQALAIAIPFFQAVGKAAHEAGVEFLIEPNAPQYACDFVTTAAQGAALVAAVDTPGFGLHLDAACMSMVGDRPSDVSAYGPHHFHVSAPMLGPVPDSSVPYSGFATALKDSGYDRVVSIEMKPEAQGNLERVEQAVRFTQQTFAVQ